jgi:hypothetical protein
VELLLEYGASLETSSEVLSWTLLPAVDGGGAQRAMAVPGSAWAAGMLGAEGGRLGEVGEMEALRWLMAPACEGGGEGGGVHASIRRGLRRRFRQQLLLFNRLARERWGVVAVMPQWLVYRVCLLSVWPSCIRLDQGLGAGEVAA